MATRGLYGPECRLSLSDWLDTAIIMLSIGYTPALFVELRYDRMNRFYPHGVFSVNEATPEFFRETLDHLVGDNHIADRRPGNALTGAADPYWVSYRDWVRAHRRAESKSE